MRVLVTGGCGFIGSHFVRRLVAAGEEVVVLDKLTYAAADRTNLKGVDCEFHKGDIAKDADLVGELVGGVGAVVNFAAETHVDRSLLSDTTWEFGSTEFIGTRVLLEAM